MTWRIVPFGVTGELTLTGNLSPKTVRTILAHVRGVRLLYQRREDATLVFPPAQERLIRRLLGQ